MTVTVQTGLTVTRKNDRQCVDWLKCPLAGVSSRDIQVWASGRPSRASKPNDWNEVI